MLAGWSGIFNIGGGNLFGTAGGPRTVLARADSFTGPPQRALPFNLEEDEESVDSVRSLAEAGPPCRACMHLRINSHDRDCAPVAAGSILIAVSRLQLLSRNTRSAQQSSI